MSLWSSFTRDPFYSSTITDYNDPLLSTVTDLSAYIGRPRMNLDMSEKGDHYCVCAGK